MSDVILTDGQLDRLRVRLQQMDNLLADLRSRVGVAERGVEEVRAMIENAPTPTAAPEGRFP